MTEEKIRHATDKAIKLLEEKLIDLPYFNDVNLNNNTKTLKKILCTDNMLINGMIGLYISNINTLIFDETKIDDSIDDEKLTILILHELIHMASANLKTNTVGFQHETLPITYNEGLTQWLTLKLYYGKITNEVLLNNIIYPTSTFIVNKMVNDFGEKEVYNGFFEADIIKNKNEMDDKNKEKWLNYILEFSDHYEEYTSKNNMDDFNKKVTGSK